LSCDIFPYSTLVIKERKRKKILNNNLAVLPSHNIYLLAVSSTLYLECQRQVMASKIIGQGDWENVLYITIKGKTVLFTISFDYI